MEWCLRLPVSSAFPFRSTLGCDDIVQLYNRLGDRALNIWLGILPRKLTADIHTFLRFSDSARLRAFTTPPFALLLAQGELTLIWVWCEQFPWWHTLSDQIKSNTVPLLIVVFVVLRSRSRTYCLPDLAPSLRITAPASYYFIRLEEIE